MPNRNARGGLLTFAVLAFAATLANTVGASAFRGLKVGDACPEFVLKTPAGEERALSSLRGKVAVVVFANQGQQKSEQALEALSALKPEIAAKCNVLVVVGNGDEGDLSTWRARWAGRATVVVDPSRETFHRYGVFVAPATAVVRADGVFQGEVSGYSPAFPAELERLVRDASGEAGGDRSEPWVEAPGRGEARKETQNARVLAAKRRLGEAVEAARRAVAADGSFAGAHSVLGNLLLDVSDDNRGEASAAFQRAKELNPKDGDAQVGVARVKALGGDWAGAVALLEEAAKLNPKPQAVWYRLGTVYQRAGNDEKALEAFRKAFARMQAE